MEKLPRMRVGWSKVEKPSILNKTVAYGKAALMR